MHTLAGFTPAIWRPSSYDTLESGKNGGSLSTVGDGTNSSGSFFRGSSVMPDNLFDKRSMQCCITLETVKETMAVGTIMLSFLEMTDAVHFSTYAANFCSALSTGAGLGTFGAYFKISMRQRSIFGMR